MGLTNLSRFLDKSSLKSFLLSPETVSSRKSGYASIITFPFKPGLGHNPMTSGRVEGNVEVHAYSLILEYTVSGESRKDFREDFIRRLGEVGLSHCGLPLSCHLEITCF